eukprot:scaffold226972_cov35-Prasinocladus_malaysianus.AAC.2
MRKFQFLDDFVLCKRLSRGSNRPPLRNQSIDIRSLSTTRVVTGLAAASACHGSPLQQSRAHKTRPSVHSSAPGQAPTLTPKHLVSWRPTGTHIQASEKFSRALPSVFYLLDLSMGGLARLHWDRLLATRAKRLTRAMISQQSRDRKPNCDCPSDARKLANDDPSHSFFLLSPTLPIKFVNCPGFS